MLDAIALLQDLGFTEQEARAYQALLQHNPVTGYELAKVSGIPRPNTYPVLEDHLAPTTHPVLAEVDPHGVAGWLAYMRQLIRAPGYRPRDKPA
jgi:hypothetical protein